jgi:hypothetical protein
MKKALLIFRNLLHKHCMESYSTTATCRLYGLLPKTNLEVSLANDLRQGVVPWRTTSVVNLLSYVFGSGEQSYSYFVTPLRKSLLLLVTNNCYATFENIVNHYCNGALTDDVI